MVFDSGVPEDLHSAFSWFGGNWRLVQFSSLGSWEMIKMLQGLKTEPAVILHQTCKGFPVSNSAVVYPSAVS